ncbi:acetolactate synthase small subunit [candidate division KSB3 bacterium]|uniref:Acetolactate synthase small subunit n=1 Tax=candidate division KSB3 bacterium TaxID=2044937 RepID=A0A2G6E471_9BACT|nr:MAG: acetolactate synthase small subunit [candidate division KSB3 bacterium]PIE29047.1 MAG: acetolactate synthase small subunit [candidate division KSB3 bacterium]
MKHTISVLVENKFGVLARVASLFSAKGYNIESLSVGETMDPDVSRMTIVVPGDEAILEQIVKQLRRLIDIIKVSDLTQNNYVDREMVLIKVKADPSMRSEILNIVDIFRGKIVDVSPRNYTIEITGDRGKIDAIITMLTPFGIKDIARTGKVAMLRGLQEQNK